MTTESNSDAIQRLILNTLDTQGTIADTRALQLDDGGKVDQQVVLGVLKRLEIHEMVEFDSHEEEKWVLTAEGEEIVMHGSYEAKVFNLIQPGEEGTLLTEINAKLGEGAKIGLGKAFQNKWIAQKGSDRVVRAVASIEDHTQKELESIRSRYSLSPNALKELKKRKLVDKEKHAHFSVRKGSAFSLSLHKLATDLTVDLVQNKAWQQQAFKAYNYNAAGMPLSGGHLHPLMKVREEFRHIFLEMGFSEMPTNRYVESSFWNFDVLFQPQQHPSRDAHDTFFLKEPSRTLTIPADYMARTKEIHERGGFGSIGHRCDWNEEESHKNILRTHTTAISSQMLYRLAQQKPFRPTKYFSIDRVFRNETLDATHLAEFHQIEGLIADYNLTLGDLIGMLKEFFRKLGMTELRFKPAFNPYTEPSMEVFAYHPGLRKWIEVGNSGIFRPEMLRPMGFDERVTVIAWGLSLERPTMIKYQLSNIRELFGHKIDLSIVQSNPICRLDKT